MRQQIFPQVKKFYLTKWFRSHPPIIMIMMISITDVSDIIIIRIINIIVIILSYSISSCEQNGSR